MRIIGLTGGIGSGKSTVSKYLKEKGIIIIDADEISRNLTSINGESLPKIREYFGDIVFNDNGSLNRKALANIVFNDKEKLKLLESCTTDVVNVKIRQKLERLKEEKYNGIVVLDIPLLFEGNDDSFCDETWLVICDLETRVNRIMMRDNIDRESVLKRINSQMSDEEKIKRATYILDNSKDREQLYRNVDSILAKNICNY